MNRQPAKVYVMVRPDGIRKIGQAVDPAVRAQSLCREHGTPYAVEFELDRREDAYEVEQIVHKRVLWGKVARDEVASTEHYRVSLDEARGCRPGSCRHPRRARDMASSRAEQEGALCPRARHDYRPVRADAPQHHVPPQDFDARLPIRAHRRHSPVHCGVPIHPYPSVPQRGSMSNPDAPQTTDHPEIPEFLRRRARSLITPQEAVERAIGIVCSDGDSDVTRVAQNVLSALYGAGFQITRVAEDVDAE